ncbi:hypothetical protein LTR10_011326 [Elasticomyces elasticus]|nr:hypothetical protein LTR10_011326 [Elasticomyces elasticus]KAK4966260.1 hypothetical protein LTR42_011421 [Elasticomyces elasticus]
MPSTKASAAGLRSSLKRKREPGRCYLLEVPPELRLHIYEFLYADEYQVAIYVFPNSEMQSQISKTSFRPNGPNAKHLTALLMSCKLVNKEATPILYQILHFSLCFRNGGRKASYRKGLGQLRQCQFAKRIEKMSILIRVDHEDDSDRAVERLDVFFKTLQPDRTIKIVKMWLTIGNHPGMADAVLRVLMCLNCRKGFEVYRAWANGAQRGLPVAATEKCWQDFLKWSRAVAVGIDGRPCHLETPQDISQRVSSSSTRTVQPQWREEKELNDNKENTPASSVVDVLANTVALVHISGKHSRTSLLGLPCELRLRIYELVFSTEKRSTVNVYLGSEVCITNLWKMPSLALTCELISEESLPVLYQSVRYDFVFNGGRHDPNWVSKNDTMLNGLTFAKHIR